MTNKYNNTLEDIICSLQSPDRNIVDHEDSVIEYKEGIKIDENPSACVDVFLTEATEELDIIIWGIDEDTKDVVGLNKQDFGYDTMNKFEKRILDKSNSDYCGLLDIPVDSDDKENTILLIGYSYSDEYEKTQNMFNILDG